MSNAVNPRKGWQNPFESMIYNEFVHRSAFTCSKFWNSTKTRRIRQTVEHFPPVGTKKEMMVTRSRRILSLVHCGGERPRVARGRGHGCVTCVAPRQTRNMSRRRSAQIGDAKSDPRNRCPTSSIARTGSAQVEDSRSSLPSKEPFSVPVTFTARGS